MWFGSLCTMGTLECGPASSLMELMFFQTWWLVRKWCYSLPGICDSKPREMAAVTPSKGLNLGSAVTERVRKAFRWLASMFIVLSQNHMTLYVKVLGHKPEQAMSGNENQSCLEWKSHPTNVQGTKLRIEVITVVFIQHFLTDPFPHSESSGHGYI